MFSELVKRNSRRSRRENGLFFASLLIAIIAFYIILSLSHQDVMVFLKTMESDAVNRLLTLVPALYVMTLCILFFLVYYANRFQLRAAAGTIRRVSHARHARRTLFGMLLAEDLHSSVIALAIGLPAAVLISELISLVTARLVGSASWGIASRCRCPPSAGRLRAFLRSSCWPRSSSAERIVREEIGALLTETPEGNKRQAPRRRLRRGARAGRGTARRCIYVCHPRVCVEQPALYGGHARARHGGHTAAVLRPARHHRPAGAARRPRGQTAGI